MSLETILSIHLPKEVITLLISALPGFGLSVSLPIGINLFDLPWYYAFLLAVIGNMLPVPILLFFWNGLEMLLSKVGIFRRLVTWLHERTRRNSQSIEKYGFLGLALFVAIPAPFTGSFTGALGAAIIGMKFWTAFWSILVGVIGSSVIITSLCLLGWFGAALAVVGLIGLAAISLWKKRLPAK